jgi:hypothetical protein
MAPTVKSDRLTLPEVAKLYGTRVANINRLAAEGVIPFQRVEHFVRNDGTTGERYVFLRSVIEADLRRSGELAAERRAS